MSGDLDSSLESLDPEIERTFLRRRREHRRRRQNLLNNYLAMAANREGQPVFNPFGVDDGDISILNFAVPNMDGLIPGIMHPEVEQGPTFELKPIMFQIVNSAGLFHGLPNENPYKHMKRFVEIADTFQVQGVSVDVVRLKLFPYSVTSKAKEWLDNLTPHSVTTWAELAEQFLIQFFPPNKINQMRNEIQSFRQEGLETLYQTWERFKDMLRQCPNHGIPKWLQIQIFYNGLGSATKTIVDSAANGIFLQKSFNEAFSSLEQLSKYQHQWAGESRNEPSSSKSKAAGVYELDSNTALEARMASLENSLRKLSVGQQDPRKEVVKSAAEVCEYCQDNHSIENCPYNANSVNYVGNFRNNAYPNNFSQGWKQHQNFTPMQGQQASNQQQNNRAMGPPGFQPRQNVEQNSSLEHWLKQYITKNDAAIAEHTNLFKTQASMMQNQSAALRNLEIQVGQLAESLVNRQQGTLPSNTEEPTNSNKGKEQCKAIELRNGRLVDQPDAVVRPGRQQHLGKPGEDRAVTEKIAEPTEGQAGDLPVEKAGPSKVSPPGNVPPPPFPQRLKKQKMDKQFKKFLDILKQLHINIPLVEALEQMPTYVKFMKDILSNKRKMEEYETVALTQESSKYLLDELPPKLKDPGSFTIPCTIGNNYKGRALCDLGASINLMPLSVFKQLGVGEARPTTVSLQLADRSIAYPEGKIEDVLVQVDKFIFPADFIILDFEADREVPIILGRPFLATGGQ